ncbi:neuronal acetylcholine receptor subunit alpha-7-like [Aplysia californica]|uniref:Neuronal acetylcholine receptor subunit alpha-7-like n=1 Tax=Aplysia californica TaxID=6500 RepID=A0ABM1A4D9_APLCA|nr:neuronal acetylcholine receptor subunit alpha-7-like [Aplysia californica]
MSRAVRAIFYLLLNLSFPHESETTVNDTIRLYRDLIEPYSNRIRPLKNQSKPVIVHLQFCFRNILNVDEVTQQVHLNAWVNFSWVDELRTWDPTDYDGVSVIHPNIDDVWLPRVQVPNSLGRRDLFQEHFAMFAIFSNGESRWFPGAVFSIPCGFDMKFFPFDLQTCQILFMANEYATEIYFVMDQTKALVEDYQASGEWDVVSSDMWVEVSEKTGEKILTFTVKFDLKRRSSFFVLNVLVPTMFISALSSTVFILPEDSGERASFAVTILMSLSVFLSIVSGELPQNSNDFPLIFTYLFSLLTHSGVTVLATVIQLRYIQTKKAATDSCSNSDAVTKSVKCSMCDDQSKLASKERQHEELSSPQEQPPAGQSLHKNQSSPEKVSFSCDRNFATPDNIRPGTIPFISTDVALNKPTVPVVVGPKSPKCSHNTGNDDVNSESCRGVRSFLMPRLADINTVLFLSANVLWAVLTVYFLGQLF